MTITKRKTSQAPRTLDDLAALPRWVAWRAKKIPGQSRISKEPIDPKTGRLASVTNPRTWGTKAEAEKRAKTIGIVLGDIGDGETLAGIDLDNCIGDDGTIHSWARKIIEAFDSYAETSPSGLGIHILFRLKTSDIPQILKLLTGAGNGRIFDGGDGRKIEFFINGKYFTVTRKEVRL